MFAIVDLTRRASRGQILMMVDDQASANAIAWELNNLSTHVAVQYLTHAQVDRVLADRQASGRAELRQAIA